MRRPIVPGLAIVVGACLIACGKNAPLPVASESSMADSADQVMYGIHFMLTEDGVKRADVFSDTIYFMDEGTRLELRHVKTLFFDKQGKSDATLTSDRGRVNNVNNEMRAMGNVHIVTEDRREMWTPELLYSPQRNELSGDSTFRARSPRGEWSGVGFKTDPDLNEIQIFKNSSGRSYERLQQRPKTDSAKDSAARKSRDSTQDTTAR
jgi:LPS export ABC transporter protein LptC